jgi:lipopolysaccharide/colanic/teichoic acid biosynthesis glycosyltransferase
MTNMVLWELLVGICRLSGRRREPSLDGLHSAEELRRILERERARADRTGDVFSLIAFSADDRNGDPATLAEVAAILKRRLRSTDELGWLDTRRLGAVLPSTSAAGAGKVAEEICSACSPNRARPSYQVYCYPVHRTLCEPAWGDTVGQRRQQPVAEEHTAIGMESLFVLPMPAWKRCLDVIGATVGLVVFAPLMAIIAAAIKLTAPGPVFFKQMRDGLGGRRFVMYKFRSMVVDAEAQKQSLRGLNQQDGPAFKIKSDPRVTWFGQFLRRTSLDELPQLWNVLVGDMSLVGPRPLPCDESDACQGWLRRRLDVTPGLTCIWQVKGRSQVSFAEWVRMDIQYARRRSLWHDLALIAQTIPAVLWGKGAS